MHTGTLSGDHVRSQEGRPGAGHLQERAAAKVLPEILYAAANGGSHRQAAGAVDEKAQQRTGTITINISNSNGHFIAEMQRDDRLFFCHEWRYGHETTEL